jgi:hypothetical protein
MMTLGISEILALVSGIIGVGWTLLRMSLGQFEKRLDTRFESFDEKFKVIDKVVHDIQKLELEQIKAESKFNIIYATKEELMRVSERHEKTIERIFDILRLIESKLEAKLDREAVVERRRFPRDGFPQDN